ncbi:hypothetical protein COLO4_35643 [Corchorus olitorius]|uniref:Uncharacterized protein n=1 Tax=Corchorus olitorius TaxID=93759 RepID=A0A1R3GEB0_9ROSI|nr:hypothetical protein COLO4_35643 [Corchorus olitorius]
MIHDRDDRNDLEGLRYIRNCDKRDATENAAAIAI